MSPVSRVALEAGLPEIRCSPADGGRVELIVRRPAVDEREVLAEATLDPVAGLVGDTWGVRPSSRTPDGAPHPEKQLTVINARLAALIAGAVFDRQLLAGDQLYVDLDLSVANLPPGSRLQVGSAVIEVTAPPHLGCAKFSARYGPDALRFVNSATGKALRLRGLNARILVGGAVCAGDAVTKLARAADSGPPAAGPHRTVAASTARP
jgi:MOSC domain-containing protein YiiM